MGKLLELILHPDELLAAISVKQFRYIEHPRNISEESENLQKCYELLNKTSRSFAAVIQELHPELRDTVMLFYVILRGLDTIEDDMTLSNQVKIPLLREFDQILDKNGWTFNDSGPNEKDAIVLQQFDKVIEEFHNIKPKYQQVIKDITNKMGNGMADYVIREQDKNYDGLKTIEDYSIYCHHVAGVVGEGITRLALLSKFGTQILEEKPQLMESMGQFLQKTNIIRDFREDLDDGRSFWPKEVWGKYANELSEFTDPGDDALYCVSDLACLSLQHVTELLEYLQNVKESSLFRFCAIPQVMSIATLELIFNNPEIFKRHIKLRRGTTAKLILASDSMDGVYKVFRDYTRKIHLKNRPQDPNYMRIEVLCGKIEQFIDQHTQPIPKSQEELETEQMEKKIILAGGAGLFVTCGIMVAIAWYMGARFDIVWVQCVDFFHQLWNTPGEHMPGYEQKMASLGMEKYKTLLKSGASSVVSTVASEATKVVSKVHDEL